MSTFLNTARARTLRPGGGLPRPRLTIVPKVAARAPRIPFALLVVSVLAAGLIGLLLLNTALQRGAYAVTALQQTSADLTLRQQNLETEVAALEAPQRISERAVRLGMVAGDSPAFISLRTGKIVGVPQPGTPDQRPDLVSSSGSTAPTTVRSTPPGAGDLPVRSNDKIATLVSGEAASVTTGAVKVPKTQAQKQAEKQQKHHDDPSTGNGSQKHTDTQRTSTDHGHPRDTKNTSTTD